MLLLGAGIAALLVAALVAIGLYGARQLMRPPLCEVEDTAARWELPEPEHVWFRSADGLRLSGWWFESADASGSVVVCHGFGGNKITNLWVAAGLFPRFNVLLLDTRGHGDSEGSDSSVGFMERLDVCAAADWAATRSPHLPVGALGISMGAAATILAAADCPRIQAVVADSSFACLRVPVRENIAMRGYPRRVSPALAWLVCRTAAWRLGAWRDAWLDPVQAVAAIAPRSLLLIHGAADDLIPVSEAHALFSAAGEPKELWIEPGVGHALVADVKPEAYRERVVAFLERWLAPPFTRPGEQTPHLRTTG